MNIEKLLNSPVHEDVVLAAEFMAKMTLKDIKKLLIRKIVSDSIFYTTKNTKFQTEGTPNIQICHEKRGLFLISNVQIWFSEDVSSIEAIKWGYKLTCDK